MSWLFQPLESGKTVLGPEAALVGTGSVTGSLTSASLSSSLFVGTGVSSGSLTDSALASSTLTGTGSVTGSLSDAATGASALVGTGSVSGSLSDVATGASALVGTGSVTGSLTSDFQVSGSTVSADLIGTGHVIGDLVTNGIGERAVPNVAGGGTFGRTITWESIREEMRATSRATNVASMCGTCGVVGSFGGAHAVFAQLAGDQIRVKGTLRSGKIVSAAVAESGATLGDLVAEWQLKGSALNERHLDMLAEMRGLSARLAKQDDTIATLVSGQAAIVEAIKAQSQARVDAVPKGAAERTRNHVAMLHSMGATTRKTRVPRQRWPHDIERQYGEVLVAQIERARGAITDLKRELPALLAAHNSRTDADEPKRARELIARARKQLEHTLDNSAVEDLAKQFATKTQTYQRIQLGRQTKAALGADVFAGDPGLRKLTDGFVSENVALIKNLPQKVMDEIEALTTRAFTSGTLHPDLAAEIEDRLKVGESRARLIARDQIGKLYGQTNAARQQSLGITNFVWRTAHDERVRPEHVALDGQTFEFATGAGEEGLPGEPICCRCFADPVFDFSE